ncbi:MAG: aminopeptidase P family protein [Clostridium argentinense]|uniref:Aminopeptidase P family protein n=1 Tax=Clostridium faecium TaxID=2762223 RepID=A0ABR8YUF6_9CLOT|nr:MULTISPECIES: Xaa-Pro peptidase family protein [Clostridium]MBD8047916.1 aminopeptidase P family protein [Clostridium faecium]MBS5822518.1 aminopeptidase P family protein [Clostridium argentinense]MDU1347957.1 Xaa-Pro peptidase family protein [Clostridium argentinense]
MKIERLNKVLKAMQEQNIPQIIVCDSPSIFYLTGKWIKSGERLLALYLNVEGNHKLFLNELFPVYEDLGIEKIWFNDSQDGVEIISKYVDNSKTIGIDKNWPARFLLRLMELSEGCKFVNGSSVLDTIRMCKDEEEKDLMRDASKTNDMAMEKIIDLLSKDEYSEKKMAQMLLDIYVDMGAEGYSFSPIVAYGANGADPHHEIDDSMVKEGDSIIIDIGCLKNSYCSDMTRTVFYKSVSDKAKEVYNVVLEANKKAIETVKPGVRFCDIDAAARNHIERAGYGKYFTHRTGHSIGIEVHDFGDVSSVNTNKVKSGMIFSIEPGIYLPGEFGVRIEDLVLVTEDGCEVLNKYDKELKVIG